MQTNSLTKDLHPKYDRELSKLNGKKTTRCGQMSLGVQNHAWLRTTELENERKTRTDASMERMCELNVSACEKKFSIMSQEGHAR